jgi:hypothetical protein
MSLSPQLDFETFLSAPLQEVALVAPDTLIFAPGGTRRSAAFAGIKSEDAAFIRWSRRRASAVFALMFEHGARHIFMGLFTQSQYDEVTGGYRERIVDSIKWGVAGPEALAEYDRLGWRVHLWGAEQIPALAATAATLKSRQPRYSDHNLWWFICPRPDWLWRWQAQAFSRHQVKTQAQAIHALYGEAVPLATLFLSFGKPMISPDLFPPLLMGELQCYWSQRPSYDLDQRQFRAILYDYAYQRATWRADKTGRAEEALAYKALWENGPTLGLGTRVGPHWYPSPIPSPDAILAE